MIPAFDELLPSPYNEAVLTLLFWLVEWHALAKLHMHTETKSIGQQLHHFCKFTCGAFETVELPKEAAACGRRKQAKATSTNKKDVRPDNTVVEIAPDASAVSSSTDPAINSVASQPVSKLTHRRWLFNMNTGHTFLVTMEQQFNFLVLPIPTPPKWLAIFHLFLSEQYWTVFRGNSNTVELNGCMDKQTNKKPSSKWPGMNTVRCGFYAHSGRLLWTSWKTSVRVQLTGTMFHLIQVMNCPILTPPCTITSRTLIDITRTCLHFPSIYQMTPQWKWVQTINDPIVLTFL